MSRASPLQRILAPLSVDEFVDKYFQRRPLRLPGSPEKFDFLFRQREFQYRLDRTDNIRAVFPQNWQAKIHPGDIRQMVNAGATICVTGMEKAHPKLARAAKSIRSELNYAGNVLFRAYLSPPGAGFDLHFDARVTTTLQIAGTKRWWFSKEPALPYPQHNSGKEPPGERPDYDVPRLSSLRSVLLRPGDILCLPAGVWHRAKATSMCLALNLAFDHGGAGVFDSIVSTLQRRLVQDPVWREPLPLAPRENGRRLPTSVAAVLRERIDVLQAELSAIRDDEAELKRAWQSAVRDRQPL